MRVGLSVLNSSMYPNDMCILYKVDRVRTKEGVREWNGKCGPLPEDLAAKLKRG